MSINSLVASSAVRVTGAKDCSNLSVKEVFSGKVQAMCLSGISMGQDMSAERMWV